MSKNIFSFACKRVIIMKKKWWGGGGRLFDWIEKEKKTFSRCVNKTAT